MPEWVKNTSDKPIPEPYSFTPAEQAKLHNLQRRKHLEKYDEKYKRMPLCSAANCNEAHVHERDILDEMERRIRLGTTPMFRCIELRFAPDQIFEVPSGVGASLAAMCPEKLQVLQWKDVRHLNNEPPKLRFQTVKENLAIIIGSDSNMEDGSLHHVPVTVEMKDGRVRHGDSKQWDAASSAIDPDFARIMTSVN